MGDASVRPEVGTGSGGAARRVHVDRYTQDRLLAVYWTHIHVCLVESSRASVCLHAPSRRMSGRCSTSPNFTPPPCTNRCCLPCSPPHPPFPRRARRSWTRPRPNSYSTKPKMPFSLGTPVPHPVPPRPQPPLLLPLLRETISTRFPRRNLACKRSSA